MNVRQTRRISDVRCPWCGNKNSPEVTVCAFCEKDLLAEQSTDDAIERLETLDLPTPEIVCPTCGAHHTALAEYCTLCGARFTVRPEPPRPEQLARRLADPYTEVPEGGGSGGTRAAELDERFDRMVSGLAEDDEAPRKQLLKIWVAMLALGICGLCMCSTASVGRLATVADRYDAGPSTAPVPIEYPEPGSAETAERIVLPVPPGAKRVAGGPIGDGAGYLEYTTTASVSDVANSLRTNPAVLTLAQQGWTVGNATPEPAGFGMQISRTDYSGFVDAIAISVRSENPSDPNAGSVIRIEYHVPGADVVGSGL